jgi:hypothetical protein
MSITQTWKKEPGARIQGSRPLDNAKLLAPCIVRNPAGGFRLFYTAVGPQKPFAQCQGYILSAVSDDGLNFEPEPGIRLAPREDLPHMCIRALCCTVAQLDDRNWRMYFESRGPAERPNVICSAVSNDMLNWELEDGSRLEGFGGLGGPRYLKLPDGRDRLYCCAAVPLADGSDQTEKHVVSAVATDGLNFEMEPGFRLRAQDAGSDSRSMTAAEVVLPKQEGDRWIMFLSRWRKIPEGSGPYPKPQLNADALADEFVTASVTDDISGYRSSILIAYSDDGLNFECSGTAIEGGGYDSEALDAIHAEDMSLSEIEPGRYRMYYACCDRYGNWRIASATSEGD